MSIRTKLIHFLGGVTLMEQTESNQQSYDVGLTFAFKAIKSFADYLYGLAPDEWCNKMYDYIIESISEYKNPNIGITENLLAANGWSVYRYGIDDGLEPPVYADIKTSTFRAEWEFGRTSLRIWPYPSEDCDDIESDVFVRNCETAEKMEMAFKLAGIEYHLVIPQTEDD